MGDGVRLVIGVVWLDLRLYEVRKGMDEVKRVDWGLVSVGIWFMLGFRKEGEGICHIA